MKIKGSRKRRKPNMRQINFIEEAIVMSLQEHSELLKTGYCGDHTFTVAAGVRAY